MRVLFFVLIALVVYMVWRSSRSRRPDEQRDEQDAQRAPVKMLRCAVCSTHVPATDAVHGKRGAYCSNQHRDQREA